MLTTDQGYKLDNALHCKCYFLTSPDFREGFQRDHGFKISRFRQHHIMFFINTSHSISLVVSTLHGGFSLVWFPHDHGYFLDQRQAGLANGHVIKSSQLFEKKKSLKTDSVSRPTSGCFPKCSHRQLLKFSLDGDAGCLQVLLQEHLRLLLKTTNDGWQSPGLLAGQRCQRLRQEGLWVAHSRHRVVIWLASKYQLAVGSLVARGVLDFDEVLIVRDRLVLRQLKQADEGSQQRLEFVGIFSRHKSRGLGQHFGQANCCNFLLRRS